MYPTADQLPTPVPSADQLLTPIQAATLLGIKPQTLATWRASGRYAIPYIKVGSFVRYRPADLERWLAQRTMKPTA